MKKLSNLDAVAIGTLERVRPGPAKLCIGCQRPVYCGDARSQRIADWMCAYCLVDALQADPTGPWKIVVPEGMTVRQFIAAIRSGQLPNRN
jgi:hypothetical protein